MFKIPSGETKTFQSHGVSSTVGKIMPHGVFHTLLETYLLMFNVLRSVSPHHCSRHVSSSMSELLAFFVVNFFNSCRKTSRSWVPRRHHKNLGLEVGCCVAYDIRYFECAAP